MSTSEFVIVALITVVALAFVTAVVRSVFGWFTNPITNVADEFHTPVAYADADAEVARLLATARRADLQMVFPGTYTLSYRYSPGVAVPLAIITFPIGLLLLFLVQTKLVLTVSLVAGDAGVRVRVVGRAHKKFAEAIGRALQRHLARPSTPARG